MNRERRKQYPDDWEQQAWQCKEAVGWQCQFCHVAQHEERVSKRTGAVYPVYLHAAHANHDIGNPKPRLLCLCPTCHGKYDYQHRMKVKQIAQERMKHRMLLLAR